MKFSPNQPFLAKKAARSALFTGIFLLIVVGVQTTFAAGQIAFASNREGNWDIFVMNPDGTEVRNITQHPADDRHPSWSPDGKFISLYWK